MNNLTLKIGEINIIEVANRQLTYSTSPLNIKLLAHLAHPRRQSRHAYGLTCPDLHNRSAEGVYAGYNAGAGCHSFTYGSLPAVIIALYNT